MRRPTQRLSLSTALSLCALILFLLAAFVTVILVDANMREQALAEGESKAQMLPDPD